jgi:L-alanine-DL-glutamate epimerase-like enolase superfamily enzyme
MDPGVRPPRVVSVEAWCVPVPIARPVHFEHSGWWTHWRYVVVRVRDDDGREAASYAFIGDIPVDVMVTELVAPAVVAAVIEDLRLVGERCAQAAGPALVDVVRPAASLVEMCLWDLAAQAAGLPLWRVLSGEPARDRVPVMHVEHRREDDTSGTFAERVAASAADGVPAVKLKHYGDVHETAGRLEAIRSAVGGPLDLVVDPGWQWADLEAAVFAARRWAPYELAWIEDPFPPHRVADAATLRREVETRIAVGDLVTSLDLAERLIADDAVDVLRVDLTTMGGFSGLERLTSLAASKGIEVSPELLVEQHQHLAFAWPAATHVEIYAPDSGIWSADAFVLPGAVTFADAGHIVAPQAPGSGLRIDWETVARMAVRSSRHPAPLP